MKLLTLTDETGKVLYKTTVDNWRVDQVRDGEQVRISIIGWAKEYVAPEGAFVKDCTKSKLPDVDVDPAQDPRRRIGMGIGYGAKVVAEAMQVMRSDAANDPARRANAIAALDRYWPEWRLTDPEILGFRAATVGGFPPGNNTILYGPAAKRKAPSEEVQQEIADERTRLKQSFWTIVGPSYPTVPLKPEHRVSYPTPHKTCTCDIKDLMSTGHLTGCPEKKR
jgi:hypothetical protein